MQTWPDYLAAELVDSARWREEIDRLRADAQRERRAMPRIADYRGPEALRQDLERRSWVERPGQYDHWHRYLVRLGRLSHQYAGASALAPAALHQLACQSTGYEPALPVLAVDPGAPAGPAASAIHERLYGEAEHFSPAAQRQALHRHVRPLRALGPEVRVAEPFSFAT